VCGRRQRAFSLIEILVVLAVVAVLLSAAVPVYNRYSVRAYRTQAHADLLRCAHDLHDENVLNPIPGRIPGLGERPQGCVFHPRCAWKTAECEAAVPELIQLDGQSVACIHHENLTE